MQTKYKKVKVFLIGGTGNQFFQISRAHSLLSMGVCVEIIQLVKYKKIICKLCNWTLHDEWINIKNITNDLDIPLREISTFEILQLGIIFLIKKAGFKYLFDMNLCDISSKVNTSIFNSFVDVGYFQDLDKVKMHSINRTAEAILLELKKDDQYEHSKFLVHVRGGDFPSIDRLNRKTIVKLANHIKKNNLLLEVVTNDQEFVNDIFKDIEPYSIFKGKSAKEDFYYMCKAKNLYISNSTFGLWAGLCASINSNASIYASKNFSFKHFLETNLI